MIVAAHQPNFLPNSGFWWKLAHSDIMDLRYRAQYTERGYQRRVKMRDAWFSMPLDGKFKTEPINQVQIKTDEAKVAFRKMMHGRYSGRGTTRPVAWIWSSTRTRSRPGTCGSGTWHCCSTFATCWASTPHSLSGWTPSVTRLTGCSVCSGPIRG